MTFPRSSSLERELVARLRDSAGDNARAMSATIIVVAEAGAATATADAVVDGLMGKRPARVIHARVNDRSLAESDFSASASARCALDRGNRGVCFEDIYLVSRDDAAADPRLWGPLALRDLPSLLYWTSPTPTEVWPSAQVADRFRACAAAVDLTVIDGGLPLRAALLSPWSYGIGPMADLAWLRSERVRIAAAGLFDDAPSTTLDAVVDIDIRLMDVWTLALTAGWLRSRLRGAGSRFHLNIDNEKICSLRFRLADGREAAVDFESSRLAHLTLPDGRRRDLGFPALNDGAILAGLVDAPTADPLYLEALKWIGDDDFRPRRPDQATELDLPF